MEILKNYININYFFISLFIGLFIVYITVPEPEIIFKYPTPHNTGKIQYMDHANVCYEYVAKEISCPSSGVKDTPLQHKQQQP
jgi:hypothetical protein